MRAIRVSEFGGPEVLRLVDVPDPVPGPRQVVVALRAVGVNPVETFVRAGTYPILPALPYTPGTDGAGVVVAAGPDAPFAVGARVFTFWTARGTYAERILCDALEVFPLPEALSFAQGAALGVPYATAWRGLFQRAQARPGESILIHGASGGVGLAAVQMARAAGLRVFGTAGSEEGKRLVLAQGAHHALGHGELAEALRLNGGRGLDLIFENLANVNLGKDLGALAAGGQVLVVGSRGTVEINPRDLMMRDASVLGMRLPNATPAELESLWAGILAGLDAGTLRPVVSHELPLAEAPRAHREILSQKTTGKLVLVP